MLNTKKVLAIVLPVALSGLVNSGCAPARMGGDGNAESGGSSGQGGTSGNGGKGGKGGTTGTAGKGGSTSPGGTGGVASGTGGVVGQGGAAGDGAGGAVNSAVVPAYAGAVIHMKFDAASGSVVKDETANHNDGTIMQGIIDPSPADPDPKWSAGRTGAAADRAWESNGVDEWIRIPKTASIDNIGINNAITISIWVYINALTVVKPLNVFLQRHILGTRGEHVVLGMLNGAPYGGQNHMGTTGPQDLPLAQWVHMGLTFDSLTLTLYINGEDVSHLDTGTPISPDDTPLSIGGGINEADLIEFANGRFDEFQLYDRALTGLEVAHLAGK